MESAEVHIQKKLHFFYKKYYLSSLIKGLILFSALGLFYFLIVLYLEYFLWLKPFYRTILFWIFVSAELYLFVKFILLPLTHLLKIKKGINHIQSSKIIGNYFPEIDDKLLNILQLKNKNEENELISASIEQKAKQISAFHFSKAIPLSKNKTYLKYFILPTLFLVASFFTGTYKELSQSFERVVHHQTKFSPPAPFSIILENQKLEAIEGSSYTIYVRTEGVVVPDQITVQYNNQRYFLQEESLGLFSFTFTDLLQPVSFQLISTPVISPTHTIKVLKTPTFQNLWVDLKYPKHTQKKDEKIVNLGNLSVPEGTNIVWNATTNQSDVVSFVEGNNRTSFKKKGTDFFTYQRKARSNIEYQISTSNEKLIDYETLPFSLSVIEDEFPAIFVQSDTDEEKNKELLFIGQISDDYGLTNLSLFYYNEELPEEKNEVNIAINNQKVQTFISQFPNQLKLKKGVNYKIYFQVSDNDGVRGRKKTISKTFTFRQKTTEEFLQEQLKNQKTAIQNIEKSIQNYQQQQQQLDKFQKETQDKKEVNWNDKKKIESLINRQKKYKEMMNRQTTFLQKSLQSNSSSQLKEKKEALKQRIEELQQIDKKNKLLKELQQISEKLNREELLNKTKQLASQTKQQEKNLERILELTKRFYVEEKTIQIANKLEVLSKKQDTIKNKNQYALEKQKQIRQQYDDIKKELNELTKDNQNLREPMSLPDLEEQKKETSNQLTQAEENLKKQKNIKAKNHQKNASKKMKKMSQKMQQAISDIQSNSIDENIDDLRQILENLVHFSFSQELLLEKFYNIDATHPDYGKELKQQNNLKSYFEHIEDSLFVISLRIPTITTKIQTELTNTQYHLNRSLENFSQNNFSQGSSNQQQALTSVNTLSDFLSNLLNNLQSRMGSGKGGSFSLPTLIQQQQGLTDQIKKGLQKRKQSGGTKGNKPNQNKEEADDGFLFQLYQEQNRIKNQLNEAIKNKGNGFGKAAQVKKTMEQLENEILEKGLSENLLQKMQLLEYELLKLDKASLKQGQEKNKTANTNTRQYPKKKRKPLKYKKQFYNQIEILNRQSLPLHDDFEKKVHLYFLKKDKE